MTGHKQVIGGVNTYFTRDGDGPTLILLHGQTPGSCVHTEWAGNIDYFAQAGFSVYAFDQAGFGMSDPPDDFSMAGRIAHVKAFINFVDPTRYSLWGCSMGAYIAAHLALEGDPRIERMVFMPSSVLPPLPPQGHTEEGKKVAAALGDYTPSIENARQLLSLILGRRESVTEELVHKLHEMSTGRNFEALQQRRRQQPPPPIHAALKDVHVPTLLLWGVEDPGATPERALSLLRIMPNAELHVLREFKHWPQVEDSARVNRLVHDFLSPLL